MLHIGAPKSSYR